MSGDLQQEKRDHQKHEHEELQEYEGPALPPRVLSIDEPEKPPADADLPGPGDDTGGNELLATIEPAAFEMSVAADSAGSGSGDSGGGGGDVSSG